MSRICDICQKGYLKGNLVPRGIGRRVTRRTITRQQANIRSTKITVGDQKIKVKICTSCLKRIKFDKNALETTEKKS